MSPTAAVALWGAAFLLAHLVFTHPPVRNTLVRRLGAAGFQGAFSVLALVLLVGLVWTWWGVRHQGPLLWNLRGPIGTRAAELLVVLSYALMVAGLVAPAPSSAAVRTKSPTLAVSGATGLTRHPLMMGMAGWALCHAAMNGWAADVAFFGFFAATAIVGSAHQDWRKSGEDPAYADFTRRTRFLPLPAPSALRAMTGRAWAGAAAGALLAIAIRAFHARLFGF